MQADVMDFEWVIVVLNTIYLGCTLYDQIRVTIWDMIHKKIID